MDLVPGIVNATLLILVGVVLNYVIRDRFRHLDRLMDARFDTVDARFDAVDARFDAVDARFDASRELFEHHRAETRSAFERIEGEIAALRSDLTHVALAVGARARPQSR